MMTRKIITIIGARPQFIKAAVVSRALKSHGGFREVIVHTGQHFDINFSSVFCEKLGIPRSYYHLKKWTEPQYHRRGILQEIFLEKLSQGFL